MEKYFTASFATQLSSKCNYFVFIVGSKALKESAFGW